MIFALPRANSVYKIKGAFVQVFNDFALILYRKDVQSANTVQSSSKAFQWCYLLLDSGLAPLLLIPFHNFLEVWTDVNTLIIDRVDYILTWLEIEYDLCCPLEMEL